MAVVGLNANGFQLTTHQFWQKGESFPLQGNSKHTKEPIRWPLQLAAH